MSSNNEPSLDELAILCQTIQSLQYSSSSRNHTIIITSLASIIQYVVWGDSKDELLFLLFCEKNMMKIFIQLLYTHPTITLLHIQILQTVSILCQSVTSDTSLYYLLSNNIINQIITFPFPYSKNEDILPNYLSFLKTLSLLLNTTNIQFFIEPTTNCIPILDKCLELLQPITTINQNNDNIRVNSGNMTPNDEDFDPMIRIGAQIVLLNILRIKNELSTSIILKPEIMNCIANIIISFLDNCYKGLYSSYYQIHNKLNNINNSHNISDNNDENNNNLANSIANLTDWLFFIKDILSLDMLPLSKCILESFVMDFVYLTLLEPFHQLRTCNVNLRKFNYASYTSTCPSTVTSITPILSATPNVPISIYTSCTVSTIVLIKLIETLQIPDVYFAILIACFHPLNRMERKRILYETVFGGNSTLSSENTSLLTKNVSLSTVSPNFDEVNQYRSTMIELRWNTVDEPLFHASNLLLFWISESLRGQISSFCSIREELSSNSNELESKIQHVATLLYVLNSVGLLPLDNTINDSTELFDCFDNVPITPNSPTTPNSPNSPSVSVVGDPDILNTTSLKILQSAQKDSSLLSTTDSLFNIDSILMNYEKYSLCTIKNCLVILINTNIAISEVLDFMTEHSILRQSKFQPMLLFCEEKGNRIMENLEEFFSVLRISIRHFLNKDTRNIVFDSLHFEYLHKHDHSYEKYRESLLQHKSNNMLENESNIYVNNNEFIRKSCICFFIVFDILTLQGCTFESNICSGISHLSQISSKNLPIHKYQLNSTLNLTTFSVDIYDVLNHAVTKENEQIYVCIDTPYFILCSVEYKVIFICPLLHVHIQQQESDKNSIFVWMNDWIGNVYPFSERVSLSTLGDGALIEFYISFDSVEDCDVLLKIMLNAKELLIDEVLKMF